uniref:Putative farnesoic acid 0-methyl transferase n=1 Tax=Psorophora albipes TaxID=869069 RepID=T1D4W3_9DIPT
MAKFIIVFLALFCTGSHGYNRNTFERTRGCLQYNAKDGYEYVNPYFSLGNFRNVQISESGVKSLRMGIVGRNDGLIRLTSARFPYNNIRVTEIVLAGWDNTKSQVRSFNQLERNINRRNNPIVHTLEPTIGLMSEYSTLMFTMEIDRRGNVRLIKDGERDPFLEFRDQTISSKFIGFGNRNFPVIYFYDCPLVYNDGVCEDNIFG